MSIKVFERYGPRANPADSNYTDGSFKNESVPGANDGTPLEVAQANDWLGFGDALMVAGGETANGNPDTAILSQRLVALKKVAAGSSLIPFDNVADLRSGTSLNGSLDMTLFVGSSAEWFGYLDGSNGGDGGGNSGIIKSGVHTDDGFSIFSIDIDTYVEADLLSRGQWSVMLAGAMNTDPSLARIAVQTVLDYPANGRVVFFPRFNYVFEPASVGDGSPVFTVGRNTPLSGEDTRGTSVRIDGADDQTDIFHIAITENGGFLDVRNWFCERFTMFFNGEGRHNVHKLTGGSILGMFNAEVRNCTLNANFNNGGRCFIADGGWTFSDVHHNDLRPGVSLLNVADGNNIYNNVINGKGWGVELDVIQGAYKTVVRDNTIVNRDGAVWIINGEQVTTIRNQIEQDASEGVNQDPISSHVYIEGRDYLGSDCKFIDNNFGGGTNVNNLVYIDRASNTLIAENYGNAGNPVGFDVVFTTLAEYSKIMKTNTWRGNISNPRTSRRINVVCDDSGVGNYGCLQDLSALAVFNGWVGGGDYYKDPETAEVVILGSFNSGLTTGGTKVADFPVGFLGDRTDENPAVCSLGQFMGQTNNAGEIFIVTTAPSNAGLFRDYRFNAQGDAAV